MLFFHSSFWLALDIGNFYCWLLFFRVWYSVWLGRCSGVWCFSGAVYWYLCTLYEKLVHELVIAYLVPYVVACLVTSPETVFYVLSCELAALFEVVYMLVVYYEYERIPVSRNESGKNIRYFFFPWTDSILYKFLVLVVSVASICVLYVSEDCFRYSYCRANLISCSISLI